MARGLIERYYKKKPKKFHFKLVWETPGSGKGVGCKPAG